MLTSLGDVSIETFLKEYWQKKPLFIKDAFPNFTSPIDANELAGFALEDEVNSRLVEESRDHSSNSHIDSHWKVTHGPLPESIFSELPEHDWSLLVQHVDSLDPNVNTLLNAFRFIPNWRLDDIMVSYAPDGGGVGPHFDYFDVFLLQGEGKREWKLGQVCDGNSALIPDQPMKLLQKFDIHRSIEMSPGDLLYIPAKHAHWGCAVGESLTYSIGFRAPSHADFLLDYAQEVASHLGEDDRYRDPENAINTDKKPYHHGEISHEAVNVFRQNILKLVDNTDQLTSWLGEYSTQLKCDIDPSLSATHCDEFSLKDSTHDINAVALSAYCRSAFVEFENRNAQIFINGESWKCSLSLAKGLSSYQPIELKEYGEADIAVLENIANKGWLEIL